VAKTPHTNKVARKYEALDTCLPLLYFLARCSVIELKTRSND
ncbi:uncharacterized protein METZ01_LOCUS273574, partial [marine metagenome]